MFSEDQAAELRGLTLLDAAGQEVGAIDEVFLIPADDQAAFAAVSVEGRQVIVPLDESSLGDGRLTVRYAADVIRAAPAPKGDAVTPDLEEAVYDHYGISDATIRDDTGFSASAPSRGGAGGSADPRDGGGADDATQGHP